MLKVLLEITPIYGMAYTDVVEAHSRDEAWKIAVNTHDCSNVEKIAVLNTFPSSISE